MREFILRARKGPTTPDFSLDELGGDRHLEVVAHCIVNALFCARRIRPQTVVQLVMDGPAAPPKCVRLESDRLGSLEAGKLADLIVVDVHRARMTPLYDPVSALVYASRGDDVRTAIVNGRVVMRDRRVLTLDESNVLRDATEAAALVRKAVQP